MSNMRAAGVLAILLATCAQESHVGSIPVIYRVGWWAYQEDLTVKAISVRVADTPLHLLNNRTTMTIEIAARVHEPRSGWRPVVSALHVSDRVVTSTFFDHTAELRVTPIISLVEDKTYRPATSHVRITLIHPVETLGWGTNRFVIRSGNVERSVVLEQHK